MKRNLAYAIFLTTMLAACSAGSGSIPSVSPFLPPSPPAPVTHNSVASSPAAFDLLSGPCYDATYPLALPALPPYAVCVNSSPYYAASFQESNGYQGPISAVAFSNAKPVAAIQCGGSASKALCTAAGAGPNTLLFTALAAGTTTATVTEPDGSSTSVPFTVTLTTIRIHVPASCDATAAAFSFSASSSHGVVASESNVSLQQNSTFSIMNVALPHGDPGDTVTATLTDAHGTTLGTQTVKPAIAAGVQNYVDLTP